MLANAYSNLKTFYTISIFILLMVCLCFSATTYSQNNPLANNPLTTKNKQTISLADILKSTWNHHPKIQQARSNLAEKQALQLAAQGAFDWHIKQESFARSSGYYDGRFIDQKLTRQLKPLNSELSLGYRVSDGEFPVYEAINETLSDGEFNLKLKLSLLQGREVDADRGQLNNSQLDTAVAELEQQLDINATLFDAALSYLKWYRAARELAMAEQALALAKNRKEAIRAGVKQGDLAAITLTEYESSLLNREINLINGQQKLVNAAIELSLYLRDNNGTPSLVTSDAEPAAVDQQNLVQKLETVLISTAEATQYEQHPRYQQLTQYIAQQQNKVLLSKNKQLPKLDVEVTVAEDIGSGSETLDGTESYVGLSFSASLERREAKGKLAAEQEKLRQLKLTRNLFIDQFTTEVNKAYSELDNLKQLLSIRRQQANLSSQLINQEHQRFNAGDSNLFLVNTRERENINAQIATLDAELQAIRQKLYLLSLKGQLDQLLVL